MNDLQTMHPPQKDSPSTVTLGEITPSDTTVVVLSAALLPQELPFPLTLGIDKGVTETVLVTAINGNELTIQRGYYGQALNWIAGTVVARVLNAADVAALQENMRTLNEGKPDKVDAPTDGNFVAFDGDTGAQKDSGKKPASFAAAGHSHTQYTHKVADPVDGNLVAFDGDNGAQKDSGKKPADFAGAGHTHILPDATATQKGVSFLGAAGGAASYEALRDARAEIKLITGLDISGIADTYAQLPNPMTLDDGNIFIV